MEIPADLLVRWLRAAGEPSRLRLLALCNEGAFSVSDLAQVIAQSEPRVSRHLKILSEAGLVERLRQGQWVHYRLAADAQAASFVRGLLGQIGRRDALLTADRSAARALGGPEAHAVERGVLSRLGRALAGFAADSGLTGPLESALVVGVNHLELLEIAATAARRCTVIAHSGRAAQAAAACAQRRGFTARVIRGTGVAILSDEDIARAGSSFDAVLLDQAGGGHSLALLLEQARSLVAPHGRLWVFERYEALESARERVVEHPLARLRRLLETAGLRCARLSPLEADGEHVLAAASELAAAPGQAPRAGDAARGGGRR